jgi:hypothetical protein
MHYFYKKIKKLTNQVRITYIGQVLMTTYKRSPILDHCINFEKNGLIHILSDFFHPVGGPHTKILDKEIKKGCRVSVPCPAGCTVAFSAGKNCLPDSIRKGSFEKP